MKMCDTLNLPTYNYPETSDTNTDTKEDIDIRSRFVRTVPVKMAAGKGKLAIRNGKASKPAITDGKASAPAVPKPPPGPKPITKGMATRLKKLIASAKEALASKEAEADQLMLCLGQVARDKYTEKCLCVINALEQAEVIVEVDAALKEEATECEFQLKHATSSLKEYWVSAQAML